MQITTSLRIIAASLILLLGACGAAEAGPDELAEARAALSRGESERAVELVAPEAGKGGEAALLLARARAALARERLAAAPDDPVAQRAALDQLALALPLAADPGLRAELLATRAELAALLTAADSAAAASADTAPTSEPGAAATATPAAEAPAATPLPAPIVAPRLPRRPPPTAVPVVTYGVARRQSFEGSGNSGAFASCIDIQVVGPGGPVAGAVLGINNGEHSYQNQTDANGYTGRCGLGASTWSVVLFWTPGEGDLRGAVTTIVLSGAPEQRGVVVFQR